MMKHGFYFDPFFLLYPVRIDINTPAVIISNYQQSQIFIVRVQYIDLISFLTVTDASMQEEVPDFYGGKTNSNSNMVTCSNPIKKNLSVLLENISGDFNNLLDIAMFLC